MEWNEKLQRIIDYVEQHLQRTEEPIDEEEIAQIAGCSFGFFQKVFSYMKGVSFSEYIRCRKMTLAGYDLKSTSAKVVDISFKYGYDSPTAFTRAFQRFHGISPNEARGRALELRVFPKMQIASKQQYSWKLEPKSSFRLIGTTMQISDADGSPAEEILEFWSYIQRNGIFAQLISMDEGTPQGMFGMLGCRAGQLEYSIMVLSEQALPQDFCEFIVPEVTWAIFDCKGPPPQSIQNGWKFLNEEWLVKYPFQHAKCPELEWYSNGNVYDENYLSQIWIPVLE